MKHYFFISFLFAALFLPTKKVSACTGISMKAKDGSFILSRTIEWGGSALHSEYVVVPRNHTIQSLTPDGAKGFCFKSKYGFVGLTVEKPEFVTEGINEKGLSAGLFYFPGYGKYPSYDSKNSAQYVSDFQLVSWMLANFRSVDEVIKNFHVIKVTKLDSRASTTHWRIADATGKEAVLEIIDGQPHFYINHLGVLTNSPGFNWQLMNLNNYVNILPGTASPQIFGKTQICSFGAGSNALGLPGDITPPSRFVRAAFYKLTAPRLKTAKETVLECFHILNNFDIPIGVEFEKGKQPTPIPSATQWTSATDVSHKIIYFRTMYNSNIRKIDLNKINWNTIHYAAHPLDNVKEEPITDITPA